MRPVDFAHETRVAEVGSLSARAKMALKFSSGAYSLFSRKIRRNFKFANLVHYNKQYTPCIGALLAQETLFFTPKSTFLPKVFQKLRKSRQILILQQNSKC